jgi:hypothetical protein
VLESGAGQSQDHRIKEFTFKIRNLSNSYFTFEFCEVISENPTELQIQIRPNPLNLGEFIQICKPWSGHVCHMLNGDFGQQWSTLLPNKCFLLIYNFLWLKFIFL